MRPILYTLITPVVIQGSDPLQQFASESEKLSLSYENISSLPGFPHYYDHREIKEQLELRPYDHVLLKEEIIVIRNSYLHSSSVSRPIADRVEMFRSSELPNLLRLIGNIPADDPNAGHAALLPFIPLSGSLGVKTNFVGFAQAVGLDAYCVRHLDSIRRGIKENFKFLRTPIARDSRCDDNGAFLTLTSSLSKIVRFCPEVGSDLVTAAAILSLDLQNKSEAVSSISAYEMQNGPDHWHTIDITDKNRIFDESLTVLNSRRTDALRLGQILIRAPFISKKYWGMMLPKWIALMGWEIRRANLLSRVEDPFIITANRARYRGVGVLFGLSMIFQFPLVIPIPRELSQYLARPSLSFLHENESNWTILAEGFHSIVDVKLVNQLERRFPGHILTLLRGRIDFDIDDFFASVEFEGYTKDSPQIQWLRSFMEDIGTRSSQYIIAKLAGGFFVPIGGFRLMGKVIRISETGSEGAVTVVASDSKLLLPRYDTASQLISGVRERFRMV